MCFDRLPNECMVIIFKKISLQELLQMRRVCRGWAIIIEDMCASRKSLKLFGADRWCIDEYCIKLHDILLEDVSYWKLKDIGKDDDLLISAEHFGLPLCDLLYRLFPNVHHLVVYFDRNSLFEHLPYLLGQYSSILVSLSLFVQYFDDCPEDKLISYRILHSINRMNALRRLDLFVGSALYNGEIKLSQEIANVLPKLERFTISDYIFRDSNCLDAQRPSYSEEIRMLGQDCSYLRLEWIAFGQYVCDEVLQAIIGQHAHLGDKLKHLHLTGIDQVDFVPIVCDAFRALEYLNMDFNAAASLNNEILSQVSKLPNLIDLRLSDLAYDCACLHHPDLSLGHRPLASVVHLNIRSFNPHNPDLFNGHHFCECISAWFPNLTRLTVQSFSPVVLLKIEQNLAAFPKLQVSQLYSIEDRTKYLGRHRFSVDSVKSFDSCDSCESVVEYAESASVDSIKLSQSIVLY